jgi:hypothetical protein
MSEKIVKPAPQLLVMWKAINLVSFLILLFFPLLLMIFGGPLVLGILILGIWLILMLSVVLYLPAFFRSLEYSIDPDAVRLRKGVFWKRRTTVPYTKITNIDITQGPVERYYGLSKLHIQTAGASAANNPTAELMMYGIKEPEALKDEIMGRIHRTPVGEAVAVPASPDTPDVMAEMLMELKAIRAALEKSSQ